MSDKNTFLPETFDASTVEPRVPFEALPAGWYLMSVKEIEAEENGEKIRIPFQAEILEGDFAARLIFDGFNFRNPNPKAEQMGQAGLSGLSRAVNVLRVQNLSELCEKPFYGKVKLKPARKGKTIDKETGEEIEKDFEASNEIVEFKAATDVPPGYNGGMATTSPANPSGKPGTPGAAPKPAKPASPKASPAPPKPAAAAPTPPARPAAPTPPPSAKPTPPKPPAAPKVERKFYVVEDGETVERTESELSAKIESNELAVADPCMLEGESDWKTVGDYAIGQTPAAAAPAKPGTPPWKRGK